MYTYGYCDSFHIGGRRIIGYIEMLLEFRVVEVGCPQFDAQLQRGCRGYQSPSRRTIVMIPNDEGELQTGLCNLSADNER